MQFFRHALWSATVLMLAGLTPGQAQIPNASFESWTQDLPTDWYTNDSDVLSPIAASYDAHTGTYAVQGSVLQIDAIPVPPSMIAGAAAQGFPVNSREAALQGWYKFSPQGSDAFNITIAMMKAGNTIGSGTLFTAQAQSGYREFTANITYVTGDTPDTCIIAASILSTVGLASPGSSFVLDDLAFGAATSVDAAGNTLPKIFALSQNYPNPFNPSTIIQYALPFKTRVKLAVYDVLGREIESLADGEFGAGSYRVTFDGSRFASGTYLYRLQAGDFSQTKRLVVLK
jgi:hypothetical protein